MRLRDGLAVVHAAWMAWWQYAKPVTERSHRVYDAANAVATALDNLNRALRTEVE